MSEAKHKEWILETIDQLKKRKNRPDLERITAVLMRKHGLSYEDIVSDVEILVKEKAVLKVEFKGQISYRNAAKQAKYRSLSEDDLKDKILESFVKWAKTEQDGELDGEQKTISLPDFELWLSENDTEMLKGSISKDTLTLAVNKLVDEGKLAEIDSGLYSINVDEEMADIDEEQSIVDLKEKHEKVKAVKSILKHKKTSGAHAESKDFTTMENVPRTENKTPSPGNKKGRPPTKRKRIKKTHGPDFETYFVPSNKYSKRRESFEKKEEKVHSSSKNGLSSMKEDRCDFCLLTAECNRKGEPEQLLVCKDCQAKGHPSCMEYSEDLARRARSSPWQCIDCKTCCLCDDSGDAVRNDAMLFCDACDKGYHMDCHQPPIKEKPTGKWVCTRCLEEDLKKDAEIKCSNRNGSISGESGSTFLPTPSESPVQVSDYKPNHLTSSTLTSQPRSIKSFLHLMPSFRKLTERPVPDATEWSIEQVAKYISEAGFKEQADVFKEQEIDGRSLLLMNRSDVLQGLSIKLGPALKIYAHIQRLQTNGQVIL